MNHNQTYMKIYIFNYPLNFYLNTRPENLNIFRKLYLQLSCFNIKVFEINLKQTMGYFSSFLYTHIKHTMQETCQNSLLTTAVAELNLEQILM